MALHRIVAKKPSRRRQPLQPIKFTISVALSTLGNVTAILAPTSTLVQDFDVISTDLVCSISGLTPGEGPIDVGLAHGLYTAAEVGEALDATPTSQYGTEMERSKRQVRNYGSFSGEVAEETLNDGEAIRRKMFLRASGGTLIANAYARNRSGATLTTGATLRIQGTHWGRWK